MFGGYCFSGRLLGTFNVHLKGRRLAGAVSADISSVRFNVQPKARCLTDTASADVSSVRFN